MHGIFQFLQFNISSVINWIFFPSLKYQVPKSLFRKPSDCSSDREMFISNFSFQSADGWIEPQDDASHNQIYYFAKDAPAMNWYDADEYCANKGGFLAEPMTSEENNFLLGYAPSLGNVNWWTGNLPVEYTCHHNPLLITNCP